MFLSFVYICIGVGDQVINRFNPTTFVCLSQARFWIFIVICCGMFVCSVREVVFRFLVIGKIVDHLCIIYFFHNLYSHFQNMFSVLMSI